MDYKIKIKNKQELYETISYLRKNKIGITSKSLETNKKFPITLYLEVINVSNLGKGYYIFMKKISILDNKCKKEKNIKEVHDILRAEKLLKEI